MVDRPVGRHPARRAQARLRALRQRQGAHERLRPAGPDPGAPRADLHAARRAGVEVSDPARRQAVPAAEYRPHRAEERGRQGHRQAVPAHPLVRPSGRVRGRRRGNPLQQVAGRAAADHVHRDQSGRRRRARHQGRRAGLGDRRGERLQGEGGGARHRARRQGRRLDALPFRRLVRRSGSARQLSARAPIRSCSAKARTRSRPTATIRPPACRSPKSPSARSRRRKEAGPWHA